MGQHISAVQDLARKVYGFFNRLDALVPSNGGSLNKQISEKQNDLNPESMIIDTTFPLDSLLLSQFERAFDADFSNVVIHVGANADRLARNAGAEAVTRGSEIFFSRGKYHPESEEGLQLIAHELAHIVQFQQSNRMVYHEDIDELEFAAEMIESVLEERLLHNIDQPILNLDNTLPALNQTDFQRNSMESLKKGGDKKDPIDGFTSKSREIYYELHLDYTGSVFKLTKEEYEAVLKKVWVEYKNELNLELDVLPELEKEKRILQHLKMFGSVV